MPHANVTHLPTAAAPTLTPLLYRVDDAAAVLSLSRSVMYELIRSRRIRSVTEGRTRLIPATALTEYITRLESEAA